jgi:hypothetical protein
MIKQWVNKGDLDSFIEATYLGVPVASKGIERYIYVNPMSFRYLFGKVVIINDPTYPQENIDWMARNGIKIISRLSTFSSCDIEPYLMRIEFKTMWNGDVLKYSEGQKYSDLFELMKTSGEIEATDTGKPMKIFLPKILNIPDEMLFDEEKNLTCLGWAMHQVGVNVRSDIIYQDLDVLKTKKVIYGTPPNPYL